MVTAVLSGGEFGGEIVEQVNIGDTIEKLDEGGTVWVYVVTSFQAEGRYIATFSGCRPPA